MGRKPDFPTMAHCFAGQKKIGDELVELAQLVYYRPSVLAEAMAQNASILQYFSGILSFNLR